MHDFEEGWDTYVERPGYGMEAHATFDEVNVDDYEAIVVLGGRAPEYLRLNPRVLEIVQHFAAREKPIASICHGAQILAAAGVIGGRRCSSYPAVGPEVTRAGGTYAEIPVDQAVTDRNLVTAPAWPAHPAWLAQFLEVLGTRIEHAAAVEVAEFSATLK